MLPLSCEQFCSFEPNAIRRTGYQNLFHFQFSMSQEKSGKTSVASRLSVTSTSSVLKRKFNAT